MKPFDFIVHRSVRKGVQRVEVVKPRPIVFEGMLDEMRYTLYQMDFTKLEERVMAHMENKNEAK